MARYFCDDRQDFLECVFREIKNFSKEFHKTVKVGRETKSIIFNPRRACAARVTVVVLCVCQCVQASHPLLTQLQDQVDIPTDSVSCSLQS